MHGLGPLGKPYNGLRPKEDSYVASVATQDRTKP